MSRQQQGNPYLTTAIYYFAFIGLGMATAVVGPTLQRLAKATGSSLAQISSVFLLTSFGYLLGSFAGGRVYDRMRGHPVLSCVLLVLAALMVVVPLMQRLLFLQIIFFLVGIAEGTLDVGINTLIVWLHGERVPPFMNALHAFYGVGTTLAPLIVAAVIADTSSLGTIYRALSVLILPAGLIILFLPSPSHTRSNQQAETRPAIPALVAVAAVIFFACVGAEFGFGGWIYTYTTYQPYATPALAASVNAAFWGAFTIGRVISIPAAVKFKPRLMLWVDFIGVMLSQVIILLFPSVQALLWLGTIGSGLFMASIFPSMLNDAQSRMHMSGRTTSWFFVGSSLGGMAVPWLMGQLIGPLGATASMSVVLVSMLLATATFYVLNLKQRAHLPNSSDLPAEQA